MHAHSVPVANPKNLQGMPGLGESVLSGYEFGPLLDSRPLNLHGAAALTAYQVVVMPGAATAIDRLAIIGAQDINIALIGEGGQSPIHGR